MDLGARIRSWREWKGWNQAQLAAASGLSRSAICMYEKTAEYNKAPSLNALGAIANAFGLTVEQFYGAIPKPKKTAKATKAAKRAVA